MTFRARRRQSGGQIDRAKPLDFTFNGQALQGFAGDTLASALLGAGVGIVNRSPVHNRPRGVMGTGTAEKNAYTVIDTEGADRHALASLVELAPGMSAESLWTWPPPSLVDRVRGGSASKGEEAYHEPVAPGFESATSFSHCDILIIGGGPAGLMAARAAGRAGARVILADDQPSPGGSLRWCAATLNGKPSKDWLAETLAELEALPDVQMLDRANFLGLSARDKAVVLRLRSDDRTRNTGPATGERVEVWKIGAQQIIYAPGADERTLAFGDNDVPGVMLSSAMLEYANRFAIEPLAQRIALTT
ncbi:MAG: 2Fe-2S iron-sulfur cluster-binding protein, partial [Alphaproteobacteria bacterium]|nr:2Fe-2S iron-sulfur cluster-binding protein [Alphaproteobacteria bacterium]